eukprot:2851777-Prymnesium_polylepis.1
MVAGGASHREWAAGATRAGTRRDRRPPPPAGRRSRGAPAATWPRRAGRRARGAHGGRVGGCPDGGDDERAARDSLRGAALAEGAEHGAAEVCGSRAHVLKPSTQPPPAAHPHPSCSPSTAHLDSPSRQSPSTAHLDRRARAQTVGAAH